jgi:hypothetical protein
MEGSYSLWATFIMPELKQAIKTELEHAEDPMKKVD